MANFQKREYLHSGLLQEMMFLNYGLNINQVYLTSLLSLSKKCIKSILLDFEWGYQLQGNYSGDSLYKTIQKPYRFWTRYSNEKLEARLGLQKIIFGPTQILRPLSWFDSFDIKNLRMKQWC